MDFLLLLILVCLCMVLSSRWITYHYGVPRVVREHPDVPNLPNSLPGQESNTYLEKIRKNTYKLKVDNLIDERIQNIPDTRSESCRRATYITSRSVSIIIVFFDYQFFDLRTTMASILQYTNLELVHEIILVDDGTTLGYIREEAERLVEQHQPWMKMLRFDYRRGISAGRLEGTRSAAADILVFLDTNIVVNQGWLEPLVHMIKFNRKCIAVPHFDYINDPVTYHYLSTSSDLVHSFSWSMSLISVYNPSYRATIDDITGGEKPIRSPSVRTNAFAISAEYFRTIGKFSLMKDAPAEMVEFSLRTWLCGGVIQVSPCSRVGVLNLWDDLKPYNSDSIRIILGIWMKQHKSVMCNSLHIDCSNDAAGLGEYQDMIDGLQLQCKSFSHYLNEVSQWLPWPDPSSKRFGLLRVKSGLCLQVAPDSRLDLVRCHANDTTNIYPATMMFEMGADSLLMVDQRCLQLQRNSYIIATTCDHTLLSQKWTLPKSGHLDCAYGRDSCAMHVTDPEKNVKTGRQIIMGQTCKDIKQDEEKFIQWEMILR